MKNSCKSTKVNLSVILVRVVTGGTITNASKFRKKSCVKIPKWKRFPSILVKCASTVKKKNMCLHIILIHLKNIDVKRHQMGFIKTRRNWKIVSWVEQIKTAYFATNVEKGLFRIRILKLVFLSLIILNSKAVW